MDLKNTIAKIGCISLLMLFGAPVFCQDDDGQPENIYLTSGEIKKQYANCYKKQDGKACNEATLRYAYIGLPDSAIASADLASKANYKPDPQLASLTHNVANLEAVLPKNISHRKIIMIEELPYYAQGAVFTTSILQTFKNSGYNYLVTDGVYNLETFKSNGYPTIETGPVVREPQHSNLLRVANDLGFNIAGYDCEGCAENVDKKADAIVSILKKDTAAKVLIISHSNTPAIAARVKQLTNIVPFLINESAYIKHSRTAYELPLYQKMGDNIKEPSVVFEGNLGVYSSEPGFDVSIFFPATTYTNGRPGWLYNSYLLKQNVSFPSKLKFPILVKVFTQKEYENDPLKVAVDAVEILSPQASVDIFVPLKGDYIVSFTGADKTERVMPVKY